MIMWELMTGGMPFWDQNNDTRLIIDIIKNFSPPIIKNTPKSYNELMQECWDSDPNKRPTASNIIEKLKNTIDFEENNPTEIIKSSDIGPTKTNNSDKSKPLSGIIKYTGPTIFLKSRSITSIGKCFITLV